MASLAIDLSRVMSEQGLSISQAAKKLGVSTRTVRRFIKAGKLQAELVPGTFGDEYRIPELPPDLYKANPIDNAPEQTPGQVMDVIRDLQQQNMRLAAQLGAATERIRNLESQIKLLTGPKRPWWKRLLFIRG